MGILLPECLSRFAFRRLSEKQKKTKALRFLRLCGELLFFEDIFYGWTLPIE